MPCDQPPASSPITTPRLLYVVTEDWAFLSHRLPMARAARDAGFEVHVATRVSDGAAAIEAERFILHPVPFARGSLSPLRPFRRSQRFAACIVTSNLPSPITSLCRLVCLECWRRSASEALASTPSSALAICSRPIPRKVRTVRALIGLLLRFLSNRRNCIALVQNSDDMAALISLGISKRLELRSSPDRVLTSSTSHHLTSPAEQRLWICRAPP